MIKPLILCLAAMWLSGCAVRVVVVSDQVRDLQMENAALRAANKHLLELDNGRK